MELDVMQGTVVYAILERIQAANEDGSEADVHRLAEAAKLVMTKLPVEEQK